MVDHGHEPLNVYGPTAKMKTKRSILNRRNDGIQWAVILLGVVAGGAICRGVDAESLQVFQPALKSVWDQPRSDVDKARIELGKTLYFEKRLSADGTISCNSCHDLESYGVDGKPFSEGVGNHLGGRNAPTTFNAFGHMTQFWDGRAFSLEHQAKGPVMNPVEMAMPSEDKVIAKLKSIPGYDAMFAAAFPQEENPITFDNMAIAIGAFERQLATPGRWDEYLNGNEQALTEAEKRGLSVFLEKQCTTCHNGTLLGGNSYQVAGLVNPWPNQEDKGRMEVTKQEADRMKFKVPSLRNVAMTAPYFHDGSVSILEEAIKRMGKHQLGLELTTAEINDIAAFLKALTAEPPAELMAAPTMPDEAPAASETTPAFE